MSDMRLGLFQINYVYMCSLVCELLCYVASVLICYNVFANTFLDVSDRSFPVRAFGAYVDVCFCLGFVCVYRFLLLQSWFVGFVLSLLKCIVFGAMAQLTSSVVKAGHVSLCPRDVYLEPVCSCLHYVALS